MSASFPESYDLYQVSTKSVSIWQPLAKKLISHSLLTFLHKNPGWHIWFPGNFEPPHFHQVRSKCEVRTRLVIEMRSVNTSSYRGSNSRHSPPGITGFIPSGYRRVVKADSSTHVDWLLSRSHFYNLIEDFDYIKNGRFDSYWFIFATCQVDSFTHSDSFYYNFQILGIQKNWKGPNIRSACRLQVYSSFKSSNLCG